MYFREKLEDLEKDGNPIRIGFVGAGETDTGQRGATLIEQITRIPGFALLVVADDSVERGVESLQQSGISASDLTITDDISEATRAISDGRRVITNNTDLVSTLPDIQAILIAPKDAEQSAVAAFKAILAKKHVIMLNAVADVTVGMLLKKMADNAGVVYTFSAGDEPGAILELYSFAESLGFEVIAAGKGKNNPLNPHATPDDLREASQRSIASPEALTSFVDGTKTMLEMTALANATGLVPDKRGMHGPNVSVSDLLKVFCLKEEGGILTKAGVVDFAVGDVAPGVFVIINTQQESLMHELDYLKMGKGPNYLLYRPYHLGTSEAPISVAKAVLEREASIAPLGQSIADTVAVAKRPLRVGEVLDDVGGYTFYGTIERADVVRAQNLLPLGIAPGAKCLGDIEQDQAISCDEVELNRDSCLVALRKLQEEL